MPKKPSSKAGSKRNSKSSAQPDILEQTIIDQHFSTRSLLAAKNGLKDCLELLLQSGGDN